MNSCEHSEHTRSVTSKAEFLQKYYNNKTSKNCQTINYYNAITIRLNTHPSKKNGVVNEELVFNALNEIVGDGVLFDYCWELTRTCQLHLHALSGHENQIFRKEVIFNVKGKYPELKNYVIFLSKIPNRREVQYWKQYLKKGGENTDIRPLYYRMCKFYHDPELILEDFEDMADYDIEYNAQTKHFEYIDSSKVTFVSDFRPLENA